MTDPIESFPVPFDPSYIAFAQWLYSRAADATAGPLATHFLANGFLPNALDANGNFQPRGISVVGARDEIYIGASRAWATSAPGAAGQALRLWSFDLLELSALNFGPNVTAEQYAAALAEFQGS